MKELSASKLYCLSLPVTNLCTFYYIKNKAKGNPHHCKKNYAFMLFMIKVFPYCLLCIVIIIIINVIICVTLS